MRTYRHTFGLDFSLVLPPGVRPFFFFLAVLTAVAGVALPARLPTGVPALLPTGRPRGVLPGVLLPLRAGAGRRGAAWPGELARESGEDTRDRLKYFYQD